MCYMQKTQSVGTGGVSLGCNKCDIKNLNYKTHQIPKLKCFSSWPAIVFAQYIEAKC